MDRLRERQKEFGVLNAWARCLDERLSTPREAGESCRPVLAYGMEMLGALSPAQALN
jgi:hypothetical protein